MRRAIAFVAAVVLLVSSAAALAAAGYKTGDYSGETKQKVGQKGHRVPGKVSFHAGDVKVKNASWKVRVVCTNGRETTWTLGSAPKAIDQNGHFEIRFQSGGNTGRNRFSGTVAADGTAKGSLRRIDRENAQHDTDPNGVSCDSGIVHWSAKGK